MGTKQEKKRKKKNQIQRSLFFSFPSSLILPPFLHLLLHISIHFDFSRDIPTSMADVLLLFLETFDVNLLISFFFFQAVVDLPNMSGGNPHGQ